METEVKGWLQGVRSSCLMGTEFQLGKVHGSGDLRTVIQHECTFCFVV